MTVLLLADILAGYNAQIKTEGEALFCPEWK
jgi:hypothetical protein